MQDTRPLDIRVCFRPHRTLRQSLVLKDRTPPEKKAEVVYRILRGTCGKAHIGQTGQTLNQLLKEHKRALTSGNIAQSAIAEHAMEAMHVIDWKEAQVVDSHPHYTQRSMAHPVGEEQFSGVGAGASEASLATPRFEERPCFKIMSLP